MTDILRLTHAILEAQSAGAAKPWLDQLIATLCQIVDLELHPAIFCDTGATTTDHGKAVSPTTAAQCAEDIERSRIFMQGVFHAIQARVDNGHKVNLLYAGTGPFGLLVVPLLPLFDPSQLRVTLLDIHRESLQKLERLLDYLGARPFVDAIEQADATQWSPATGTTFDVIVSETMKHLLQQEPQVRVFSHLQQFLAVDGELIPRQITLSAALTNAAGPLSQNQKDVPLGDFFQLNRKVAAAIGDGDFSVFSSRLPVPEYPIECRHLKFTTTIDVYEGYQLQERQSQLTLPRYRYDVAPAPGASLHCDYRLGSNPNWDFAVMAPTGDRT